MKTSTFFDHKIYNWIILIIVLFSIFALSGWYVLKNQEMVNLETVSAAERAGTSVSNVQAAETPDKQVEELDELNDSVLDEDFDQSAIDDSNLGL